jgi:hypothetical protein
MRYQTCGDYFYDQDGVLQIRVVELGNEKYETLIAIHELVEERLTKWKGITEQQITDFDLFYEMRRKQGLVPEDTEPGFDNNAPYRQEHTFATGIEMMMCAYAGLSWFDYEQEINNL